MKKFFLGVITGALLFGGIIAIAEQYSVSPNPFDVMLDGKKIDIEGYSINGRTYFQLRDLGDKIGFDVDFKDNTIIIDSAKEKPLLKEDFISYNDPTVRFNGVDIVIAEQNGIKYFSAKDMTSAFKATINSSKHIIEDYSIIIYTYTNEWGLAHKIRDTALGLTKVSEDGYPKGNITYIDDEPYVSEEDFNALVDKFLEICEQENITLKK